MNFHVLTHLSLTPRLRAKFYYYIIIISPLCKLLDFLGGASGKEPTCQCRRHKRCGFDPWVGKIPWRGAWQPTPVFLPGECHGQRSLVGYSPQGHTTEVT